MFLAWSFRVSARRCNPLQPDFDGEFVERPRSDVGHAAFFFAS